MSIPFPPLPNNLVNNNNTVPQQHELPVDMTKMLEALVESKLNECLWYRVQCVSVDKAADILSVYDDTVRQWIKAGKLPASKVGREWIIRMIDIDRMIARNATVVRIIDKRFKANRNKAS